MVTPNNTISQVRQTAGQESPASVFKGLLSFTDSIKIAITIT
jgi:hypothetical protein